MDAGILVGVVASLALVALAAAVAIVAVHHHQRQILLGWLDAPESPLPDGVGQWQEVFSKARRLRRESNGREAELRGALERFRLAVQALPGGVVLLGEADRIEWCNDMAASHLGLDPKRDVGTLVEQLVRQPGFHEFLHEFRASGAADPFVFRSNGDRPERTLSLSLHAFGGSGTVLLSRDVSEVVRIERIRRDFVANVSHELRTPLTVITGFVEQLSSNPPPAGDTARRFLALMSEQADRMNRLIGDLLTLSRLENDDRPPRDDVLALPALLKDVLAEAQALSGGRHVIEIAEASAGNLTGSLEEIRSVLSNLVSNAVRYTPPGGSIRLRWVLEGDSPVFAVEDSGIGIPEEHIPRLTERFYRVDKGRSASTGGTGLGLAIVKHALAHHGGKLVIASEVGKGSTFRARFPAARHVPPQTASGV